MIIPIVPEYDNSKNPIFTKEMNDILQSCVLFDKANVGDIIYVKFEIQRTPYGEMRFNEPFSIGTFDNNKKTKEHRQYNSIPKTLKAKYADIYTRIFQGGIKKFSSFKNIQSRMEKDENNYETTMITFFNNIVFFSADPYYLIDFIERDTLDSKRIQKSYNIIVIAPESAHEAMARKTSDNAVLTYLESKIQKEITQVAQSIRLREGIQTPVSLIF